MDIDLWWNLDQQPEIRDLRAAIASTGARASTTVANQARLISILQQENDDLRLRLAVLVRLLIGQGTISKGQFTDAVNEAKASIATAQAQLAGATQPKRPKLGSKAK